MHIVNCEHPVKIYNKYINEWMYVRCGKCDVCRNSRAKRWVDRLEVERSCFPYTMFFFLSYDNEHLPKYKLSYDPRTGEKFLSDSAYTFDSHFDDYCIPFNELKFEEQSDMDYLEARLKHRLGLPHGSVRDLQLFLKRFNKYCHDNITHTYRNFRYFIVCEYGPTTFRPHYHGLMFIRNQKVADRYQEILSECWRLGRPDYELVESSASSYVAQYLNCVTHLPSFYTHPKLRSFFLCSRKPPIGSLLQSEEEILEIFHDGITDRVCKASPKATKLSVVPLLPSLKDRLFPKLQRFSSLSHPLRVALYGLIDAAKGEYYQDFEGWRKYLMERCFPSHPVNDDWFDFSSFVHTADSYQYSDVARYICNISDDFREDRPLRELFRISNRVLFQAECFGVSLDYYVTRIENFYNNLELSKLKMQYETQESLLCDGKSVLDDLVHMYPIYRDNVSESLSLDLNICDVPDYQSLVAQHKEIMRNNTKVKRKKAYEENRLKYEDNELYNIQKRFYYAKKRYEDAETLPEER